MRELLGNAWLGWGRYTENGKFAALLLAVLLGFWFLYFAKSDGQKAASRDFHLGLMAYTSLMTAVCICPVTAVCLMLYQTRFYDYEWIWSLVPMTAVIAAGGSVFLGKIWENYSYPKIKRYLQATLLTAAVVLLIFFSGSLGRKVWDNDITRGERARVRAQVEVITAHLVAEQTAGEICLWAPDEVLTYARAYSGEIRLLYGRDMWDGALGAYTYEVYDVTRQELYRWMSLAEETGSLVGTVEVSAVDETGVQQTAEKQLDGMVCIQNAIDLGASCIVLPGNMQEEDLGQIRRSFPVYVEKLGDYILLLVEE